MSWTCIQRLFKTSNIRLWDCDCEIIPRKRWVMIHHDMMLYIWNVTLSSYDCSWLLSNNSNSNDVHCSSSTLSHTHQTKPVTFSQYRERPNQPAAPGSRRQQAAVSLSASVRENRTDRTGTSDKIRHQSEYEGLRRTGGPATSVAGPRPLSDWLLTEE